MLGHIKIVCPNILGWAAFLHIPARWPRRLFFDWGTFSCANTFQLKYKIGLFTRASRYLAKSEFWLLSVWVRWHIIWLVNFQTLLFTRGEGLDCCLTFIIYHVLWLLVITTYLILSLIVFVCTAISTRLDLSCCSMFLIFGFHVYFRKRLLWKSFCQARRSVIYQMKNLSKYSSCVLFFLISLL